MKRHYFNNNKIVKKTLVLSLSAALAVTGTMALGGCGTASASKNEANIVSENKTIMNAADLKTGYEKTALVVVSQNGPASMSLNAAPNTKAGTSSETDITDCGAFNTMDTKYVVPEIKAGSDVTYFMPVIGNVTIKAVKCTKSAYELGTAQDEKGSTTAAEMDLEKFVATKTVKVNGEEQTAFVFDAAGTYEVETDNGTFNIEIKSGSLFDDMLNGEAAKNIIANGESEEIKTLASDYETVLPLLVDEYMNKYSDKNDALKALATEKADVLKEYNRVLKAQGKDAVDVNTLVDNYNVPEKVKAAEAAVTSEQSETRATTSRVTTNVPQTVSTQSEVANSSNYQKAMAAFEKINAERVAAGYSPLKWNNDMYQLATIRAEEIKTVFEHTSVSGSRKNFGENIAFTPGGADRVVYLWMNSAGHKRNILDATYTESAVAYANGYWVQLFAGYTYTSEEKTTTTVIKGEAKPATPSNNTTVIPSGSGDGIASKLPEGTQIKRTTDGLGNTKNEIQNSDDDGWTVGTVTAVNVIRGEERAETCFAADMEYCPCLVNYTINYGFGSLSQNFTEWRYNLYPDGRRETIRGESLSLGQQIRFNEKTEEGLSH